MVSISAMQIFPFVFIFSFPNQTSIYYKGIDKMLIIPIVELDNSYYKDLIIPIINEFDLVN